MLRRLLLLCSLLFLAAACQDLPTAPEGASPGVGGPRKIYVLEPIVVVAECDPWTSLNWCKDGGDCMSSQDGDSMVLQGCDPGGGGGGGGSWGGGGGGTTGPTTPDDGETCPIQDPACLVEMSPEQQEAVNVAKSLFKTQFNDPAAQQACTAMANALANLSIYQGNPDIPDEEGRTHSGQYQNGVIHIDADWFNQAIALGDYRTLGFLLLHEAAHSLGYRHVGETSAPYSTFPFNHVSAGSGAETCID